MATGDLNNNIDKVRNELTSIRYDGVWNSLGISEGSPEAYLPLVHHVCINFSRFLARFLASKGYELVGKNDMRFMEEVYKILRNEFNYRPALNLTQFFTVGFAERKLILVCDLIKLCKRKHNEISKQKADAKRKAVSSPSPSLLRPPSPQVNTSKRDFDPESSLRKSGGSLNKSGPGLESSQRRKSGGNANGTPVVPKKFVASASLINNEIDVVDFRPNVSSARPPIRVIRNEPKQSISDSSPLPSSHAPSSSSTPQYPHHPPAPSHPSHPSSTPSHYPHHASPSSSFFSYPPPPTHPSLSLSNPPLPSSSAYASRNADGAWRVQNAQANANGYPTGRYAREEEREEERGEEIEVDAMASEEEREREDEEEEEDEEGEEETLPAAFRELRMNGKVDVGGEEGGKRKEEGGKRKQDNGISGASISHGGGHGPTSDKVAMHILDKLVQMETKVLSSLSNLQTSVVSLETRVKNLESLLDSPKRAIYQAPQQPTITTNNPHKTLNFHTPSSSSSLLPTHSLYAPAPPSSSSPPSHSSPSFPQYSTSPSSSNPLPLPHSPSSVPIFPASHSPPSPKFFATNNSSSKNSYNNTTNNNNVSSKSNYAQNGNVLHNNYVNGNNESEAAEDRMAYKQTTQSTQDFISSITKRFKDTRDLLSKQHISDQ